MSNRYSNSNTNEDYTKGFSKTPKRFMPKQPNNISNNSHTVSNSFRQSISRPSNDATSSGAAAAVVGAASRVKMWEDGRWVSSNTTNLSGNFVNYLPQDEVVAAGLGAEEGALDPVESQRVVDLLNRELARLLKLKPRDFWKEVASDTSLHSFIESFLKYRSRWYDFPYRGARGTVAGVIVGDFELCRRVFMFLYRISSNRDPGARAADSFSPKDHAALLQEKKLLDLPKLLDICAIYGHENYDLTRLLVVNSVKAQPWIHDELIAFLSHFLSIVHTMYQRCSSSLEVLLSSGYLRNQGVTQPHLDYLEVMDFINDGVVTLDAFIVAYKQAAVIFSCPIEMSYGSGELLTTLARLHDSLLPSLQRGLHIVFTSEETPNNMLSDVSISLKLLSMRIVNLGWKLLYFCYLSDEAFESCPFPTSMKMFPASVDDPVIRADIVVETLREIIQDGGHSKGIFFQNIEKNHKIMSRIGLLRNTGWLSMDEQQSQFLSGILGQPLELNISEANQLPRTGESMPADEDSAILESKISQIKDLFPDYGKGFLAACLEAYNQNPEEVIQRILEQTLHKDLQALDISMEEIPIKKSSVRPYDKGKGKLLESDNGKGKLLESDKGKGKLLESVSVLTSDSLSHQPQGPSNSSTASVGRYIRKTDTDLSHFEILDSKDNEYMSKNAALLSQLEYEDEYDDSFDDLGLSVGDSRLEETETRETSDQEKSWKDDNASSNSKTKWNSRKTPQFYVKDGKNYSYKVAGSVAVANYNEASIVNEAQREMIYGLGRGGNIPLGAVKRLTESNEAVNDGPDFSESEGRGAPGNFRGRGRRGGGGHIPSGAIRRPTMSNDEGGDGPDTSEVEGQGGRGNFRGRGRRGGGRNNYRKDQAMKKHLSVLRG